MRYKFSWQYEKSIMPNELLEIAFDFDRDLKKLWALELPVQRISIKELEWHLDMPFFWLPDKPFSLKPRDVLNDPELYKDWINRIMIVDTKYPIDIVFWKDKWQILDGLHRLCKNVIEGNTSVEVRILPNDMIESIKPDS